MRPQILTIAFLAFGLAACGGDTEASEGSRGIGDPGAEGVKETQIEHVAAAAASEKLAADPAIKILDIRTTPEYEAGHIAKSIHIDFQAADFKTKIDELDKAATYLVHCKSGGRSTKSLEAFKELGFAKVIHLDGGLDGWKAAELPIEK